MDVKRFLLITVLICLSVPATAAGDKNRGSRGRADADQQTAGVEFITVSVAGAVERPGDVRLPLTQARVADALTAAGGAGPASYGLATLLLRSGAIAAEAGACIPLVALHAGLLVEDDPKLAMQADLAAQLRSGQLIRVDAREELSLAPGMRPVQLRDGDLLAVPGRSGVVYVATAQGKIERLPHSPAAAADVYVEQLTKADRKGVDRYVLHYPNGQQVDLQLEAWHYRPTMVPPGSLIAPESGCLHGE